MAAEILERDDLSVYVVAGVPKSFKKKLHEFVDDEAKEVGDVMLLDEEMAEWVLAQVQGTKRRSHEQTPASSALWRAYRALSAARYHLQGDPAEKEVRELRSQIEELWRHSSPVHGDGAEEAEGVGV